MISSSAAPPRVGVVCPSRDGHWLGGLYHLQHIIGSQAWLPLAERLRFRDVWWNESPPADDPFAEVRPLMNPSATIRLPNRLLARIERRAYRAVNGYRGSAMADLFHRAGIDVLFPVALCDNIGVPLAGWILDFQYRRLPHYYTAEQCHWYEKNTRRVGEQSTMLLLSSRAVLDDLCTFMPDLASMARIVRPCSAISPVQVRLDPISVARKHNLPERFFLISNQFCTHKNHRTILDAMRRLKAKGTSVHTVCTGKPADFRDPSFFVRLRNEVADWGLSAQVHFLGALPRHEYLALMRRCLAVVQPSEFEGWGFALSDAKALGKPALASDIAVHHEHDHPDLKLLAVHDADTWAEALLHAWRELQPGPDSDAEKNAAAQNRLDCIRFAREMNAFFHETLSCAKREPCPALC